MWHDYTVKQHGQKQRKKTKKLNNLKKILWTSPIALIPAINIVPAPYIIIPQMLWGIIIMLRRMTILLSSMIIMFSSMIIMFSSMIIMLSGVETEIICTRQWLSYN